MTRFRTLLSLVLVLCAAETLAQTNYSPVGIPQRSAAIPIPLGFIDPLSGQVHLEIPLASVPQRGAPPVKATLVYDPTNCIYGSNGWDCGDSVRGWLLSTSPNFSPGYRGAMGRTGYITTTLPCPDPGFPIGSQTNYTNISFTDSHGSVFTVPGGSAGTNVQMQWVYCFNSQNQRDTNTGFPHSWSGSDPSSTYSLSASLDSTGNAGIVVTDPGGNVVANLPNALSTSTYIGGTNGNTLGQFAQSPVTTGPWGCSTPSSVSVKVSDGSTQTYTIHCQTYTLSYGSYGTTVENWISSVGLPDGTQYTFSYDTGTSGIHMGALTGVTLPTGGQLSITNIRSGWVGLPIETYVPQTVTFGGGSWNFSYAISSTQVITTVTSPPRYDSVSKQNVNDQTVYTSIPGSSPYVLQSVQYKSGSSTPLKTVTYSYPLPYGTGCLSSVTTTLNDTGQSSQIQYQYGIGCNRVTQKQEYDFNSILTRTTKITYLSYLTEPTSVSVYAGSGTGSPVSQTNYTYDEYGASYCKPFNGNAVPMLTNITGAINHDDAGHGASFSARGNVTTISRLVSGTTYVTAHTCYDTLGNVTQQVDALGNPTNYDYTENWADTSCIASGTLTRAFPTTITDALGHRAKTTRYSCTGLSSAVADENDLQAGRAGTTSTFDWANRPLCVNYPDGGQTCNAYFMTATPPYLTQNDLMSASLSIGTETVLDGYGRATQTQLTSDPSGVDYTDTTYDAFGRAASVSNPYRTKQDSTYGVTNSYYDALGRPTAVVEPDGSAVISSYSGNTAIVTDEAGKKRKTQTDGLGRLTFVWEDPSNLNFETDYAYDVLDNLTAVTQKGGASSSSWRVRTYTYDALSRLVCAGDPEIQPVTCPASATGTFPTGAVTYTYDNNGNLITKKAPAPNQSRSGTATVTTTYTYDALNRVTGKSYSDSYNGNLTPGVTYGYDGVNLTCPTPIGLVGTSGSNVIGRRSAMCYSAGNKSWIFDPMGRTKAENTRFIGLVPPYSADASIVNGVETLTENTEYNYYLNGDLLQAFYPSPYGPDYEFYTTENAAGQIITAGDTRYNVLKSATYTPAGQLASSLIGWSDGTPSYAGTTLSNTYNNRLQPVLISATTPNSAKVLNLTYNFNLGNGTTGSDNGNVIQIANGKDNNRTQNFLYDSLNRIEQAYTTGSNWGETYSPTATNPGVAPSTPGIDAWGNLTNRSQVNTKTAYEPLSCSASTSNQLSCYTYDAAGNLTQNGSVTYTYDAENRLISTSGTSYVYDGDGNRVKKCTEGTINNQLAPGTCASNATGMLYWLSAAGGTLAESDLGGNWTAAYGLIGGQIGSRLDLPANVVHYYFHDRLGSTGVVTDPIGGILKESDYYPYGGEIPISGSDPNRYKFTQQERDAESGLDYFGARHYSSAIGRFMVPDPLGAGAANSSDPQSWNLYSYVLNNPLRAIDPNGLDCVYVNTVPAVSFDASTPNNGWAGPPDMTFYGSADGNTYGVVSGDCVSGNDNGYYFDGTVDGNSLGLNPNGDVVGNVDGNTQCSGECPESVISSTSVAPAPIVGLDPNSTLGWTWNYTKSLFSLQPQANAWNNGYYKCLGKKNLPGFSVAATVHVTTDVASETASHFAPQIAGAFYHATDARFTAWGKYSKVLVPQAAGKIKLWAGRANAAGWAYADYELAKSISECSEKLQ